MQQINPIKIVWGRRMYIVVAAFVCGMAAAGASLIFPNMYTASCKLIVMPRAFVTDLNIEPFNMLVYQELAMSDSFKDRLADEFHEEYGVSRKKLDTAMKVALTKMGPARDEKYAPVMKLQVEGPSPDLASRIANRWAEMFVEESQKLITTESDSTLEYVSTQYSQVEKGLESLDVQISELRKAKTPEVLTEQVEAKRKQYGEVLSRVLDKRISYEGDVARLSKLSAILDQLQSGDGQWIGDSNAGIAVKAGTQGLWGQEAKNSVTRMVDQKKKVNDQIKDSHIYRLNEAFNAKVERLKEMEMALIGIKVDVSVLEEQLASYDESLKDQGMNTTLKRSLETEDIFNTLSSGQPEILKDISGLKVDTEVLNPVYTHLMQKRDEVNAELAGKKMRLQETEATVVLLTKEVDALKESLLEKNEKLELLSNAQEVYATINKNISTEYVQLKTRVVNLREDVEVGKVVLEQLEAQEAGLRSEINILTSNMLDYSVEINKLERLRGNAAATYATLAQKLSDAELEKAKTSPMVKVAVKAAPPVNKSSASRTLIALTGIMLGGIIGIAMVMVQAVLLDDEQTA